MKKKNLIICIIIVLFFPGVSFAVIKSPIIITGKFKNLLMEGEMIYLDYCPDYYSVAIPSLNSIKYKAKVKSGQFKFVINDPKNIAYYQIRYGSYEKNSNQSSWKCLDSKIFMIEEGTKVFLKIDTNTCRFSGKGENLLNCQYKLSEVEFKNKISQKKSMDLHAVNLIRKRIYDSIFVEKVKILDIYKEKIKPKMYEVLKLDCFSDLKIIDLIRIRAYNIGYDDVNKASIDYYKDNYLFTKPDTSNSELKIISRSYAKFLYLKELTDLNLFMRMVSSTIKPSFSQLYEKISQNYSGLLREKILTISFLNYFRKGEGNNSYFDEALNTFHTDEYRNILSQMKETRGVGQKVPNFKLTDSSGKQISFNSLKGKLLIVDFWFTGCSGCAYLSKGLVPVSEYYKNNPNVLFVSISADKDIHMWKRGIQSGMYTQKNGLNLYTNGLGVFDPIVRHFDVTAFPTLLLISKEGQIISSSPPRPLSDESRKRLIRLIDANITGLDSNDSI